MTLSFIASAGVQVPARCSSAALLQYKKRPAVSRCFKMSKATHGDVHVKD